MITGILLAYPIGALAAILLGDRGLIPALVLSVAVSALCTFVLKLP